MDNETSVKVHSQDVFEGPIRTLIEGLHLEMLLDIRQGVPIILGGMTLCKLKWLGHSFNSLRALCCVLPRPACRYSKDDHLRR